MVKIEKKLLSEYTAACALVEKTEKQIARLEKKRAAVHQVNVSGSNPEFPYQRTHFHIEGRKIDLKDEQQLQKEQQLLEERKKNAEAIKLTVQQFINELPPRMALIVIGHYLEGKSWSEVADELGRGATEDSVRKELDRYFEKMEEK